MRIGVLAVQGAFAEHIAVLDALGCKCAELRKKDDIEDLDGIVLPGGESTVQGKLLRELDMFDPLKALISSGIPTLATCAGLILLAEHISNDSNTYFGTLPVTVKRNAYGRQLGSFQKTAHYHGIGDHNMIFIRAPYVEDAGDAQVLAAVDGKIAAVQYNSQIGLAFHPELGNDRRIHQSFIKLIS